MFNFEINLKFYKIVFSISFYFKTFSCFEAEFPLPKQNIIFRVEFLIRPWWILIFSPPGIEQISFSKLICLIFGLKPSATNILYLPLQIFELRVSFLAWEYLREHLLSTCFLLTWYLWISSSAVVLWLGESILNLHDFKLAIEGFSIIFQILKESICSSVSKLGGDFLAVKDFLSENIFFCMDL